MTTAWLRILDGAGTDSSRWEQERAALALAGGGIRAADDSLRRYGGIRSTDGSWRATRWLELPRILSLPFLERMSLIWSIFPFSAQALVIADPKPEEIRELFALLMQLLAREKRDVPVGSSCLLSCADLAKERGVALPDFESCWWLEEQAWGTADAPTSELGTHPPRALMEPGHPAMTRDHTITTAFARSVLSADVVQGVSSGYGDVGSGWVLYADIDHFKKVNDYYGMEVGNAILAQVVDRLQRTLGDCVVRYGGEEFLVLWAAEDGPIVAEEMRTCIEREPFHPSNCEKPVAITISVGTSQFCDLRTGIKDAEEALIRAKNAGRNCVR